MPAHKPKGLSRILRPPWCKKRTNSLAFNFTMYTMAYIYVHTYMYVCTHTPTPNGFMLHSLQTHIKAFKDSMSVPF